MKIRPTRKDDTTGMQKVLEGSQLFPSELLPDMISGYLSDSESSDIWLTCDVNGSIVGFCYATPEEFAEGAWNMLAIAVLPAHQGTGYGGAITQHLIATLKERGERILIVDTSSAADFASARAFYLKNGFVEEARIRDFWAAGDDKITFWKSLD